MKTYPWPNRLGFDVVIGSRRYEVWESGAVVELQRDSTAPTGYSGRRYCETGIMPDDAAHAAAIVIAAREARTWQPCCFEATGPTV